MSAAPRALVRLAHGSGPGNRPLHNERMFHVKHFMIETII